MAPFVFALRESQMATALIAPSNSMSNVSSDSEHNIQVHEIELCVLDRALEHQAMILEEARLIITVLSELMAKLKKLFLFSCALFL